MKNWEIRSFKQLQHLLVTNDEFKDQLIQDPENTLLKAVVPPSLLTWDKWIYRITVGGLILIIFTIIICVLIMYGINKAETFQVPDIFVSIGSGAVGAVAGLLTPNPTEKKEE